MEPKVKKFYPDVVEEELIDWRNMIAKTRMITIKGKWPNGNEAVALMEECYQFMKNQFATGDGIWL